MNRWNKPPLACALLCALSAAFVPAVASAEVVWSQPPDLQGIKCSSELIDIYGLDSRIADDFSLDRETTITKIVFWGGYYNWSGEDPDPPFNVVFYSHSDHSDCDPMYELAVHECLRTDRTFVGFDDAGYLPYMYVANVEFAVTANTRYWCMVQACDHPYPPLWGRQQSMEDPLCDAQWYLVLNWPEWIDMWYVVGNPWGASLELRDDPPTPIEPATWGRIKAAFR